MRRIPFLIAVIALFTVGVAVVLARSGPLPKELQDVRAAVARHRGAARGGCRGPAPCP